MGLDMKNMRLILSFLSFVPSLGLLAAESGYIAPLNEHGVPDFQGTWSIATQTNLERAERFGSELVISEEEAIRIEA
tara:strand:- start:6 stop:236 length:231 start_codon:yes stop_codon:yes gene_type:complete